MCKRYKTKASTAISAAALLSFDSDGFLVHATTNTPVVGIAMEAKAASDATTTPILVDCVFPGDVLLADTTVTTPAQTDVSEDVDLVDHNSVNVGASTNKDANVVDLLGASTTQVLVTLRNLHFGQTE